MMYVKHVCTWEWIHLIISCTQESKYYIKQVLLKQIFYYQLFE